MLRVDGDGVGGPVGIRGCGGGHHEWQLQLIGEGVGDGGAEVAGGVADEKGAFAGRQRGGSDDEVAFVLARG